MNIYEEIEKLKSTIEEGDGDAKDNDATDDDTGKESSSGNEGDGGKPGTSPSGTPSGESGTPQDDAGTPSEDGGGTRQDAQAPQEDGQVLEPSSAAFARQRKELKELKTALAELKAEKTVKAAPVEKSEAPQEPSKEENYQAWLEWNLDKNKKELEEIKGWKTTEQKSRETETVVNAAVSEFRSIEDSYKKENPDYEPAIEHARGKYFDSIKMLYPNKTDKEIDTEIDRQMLIHAVQATSKGLNPAEELYDMATTRFGYKKETASSPAVVAKPSLKTISSNKKRSASPLGNGGQGGSVTLTPEAAADMSNGEFANLTPQQLRELEAM